MGKGVVMPVSASAATSGAGTPAAAKVVAGAAALDPPRRCLLRVVGGRSAGRAVISKLRTKSGRVSKATTSVETSSLTSSVRPARPDGCASAPFGARPGYRKADMASAPRNGDAPAGSAGHRLPGYP